MDAAPSERHAPPRVLAALAPRTLGLARERADGAHPYLVTPRHTASARRTLGDGRCLAPEQGFVLEPDPARARAIARKHLEPYLAIENYRRSWLRDGFDVDDLAWRRQRPPGRRARGVGRAERRAEPHRTPLRGRRRPRRATGLRSANQCNNFGASPARSSCESLATSGIARQCRAFCVAAPRPRERPLRPRPLRQPTEPSNVSPLGRSYASARSRDGRLLIGRSQPLDRKCPDSPKRIRVASLSSPDVPSPRCKPEPYR